MTASNGRNPGLAFDPALIRDIEADAAAVERRAAGFSGAWKGDSRRAGLVRVMSCMDLTSLNSDGTAETIEKLCARARVSTSASGISVAAVCVYPVFVPLALRALAGAGIRVATVAAGFPHGLSPLPQRVDEVRWCAESGADEIDVVINRSLALEDRWEELYDEIRLFRESAGSALLKVILATGELGAHARVYGASLAAMMAGADFIKTSTGKEAVNAALPAGLVMASAIREYERRTGVRVGLKPAGGIRTADAALEWLALAAEELGEPWQGPRLFRIGASALLDDIECELSEDHRLK